LTREQSDEAEGRGVVFSVRRDNRHGEGDERALRRRTSDPRWPRVRRRRS
jgi:hypothetical protein